MPRLILTFETLHKVLAAEKKLYERNAPDSFSADPLQHRLGCPNRYAECRSRFCMRERKKRDRQLPKGARATTERRLRSRLNRGPIRYIGRQNVKSLSTYQPPKDPSLWSRKSLCSLHLCAWSPDDRRREDRILCRSPSHTSLALARTFAGREKSTSQTAAAPSQLHHAGGQICTYKARGERSIMGSARS